MKATRIKRAQLRKTGDRLEMYIPSQRKSRNTEVIYGCYDNILEIAGQVIDKHPKFKNVGELEGWTNVYIATKL